MVAELRMASQFDNDVVYIFGFVYPSDNSAGMW